DWSVTGVQTCALPISEGDLREYTVRLEPPKGMSEQEQRVTVADRGCAEVSFWPRWDGRLSGTVFDAEGQPATGVRVYLIKAEKQIGRASCRERGWSSG